LNDSTSSPNKQNSEIDTESITSFVIDGYLFEPRKNQLFNEKTKKIIELKPLHSKLLNFLCINAGQPYSIDDLKAKVWNQVHLSDSAVKKAISELRSSLSEISEKTYIQTIPQKGYLFSSEYLSQQKTRSIQTNHFLLIVLVALILLIVKFSIFDYLSPPRELAITVVNKSESSNFYNTQFRKDLLKALSKQLKVSMIQDDKKVSSKKITYNITEQGKLDISLFENEELRWQNTQKLEQNYRASIEQILSELSILLALPETLKLESEFENSQAFEFFIKGKITYYHEGVDSSLAEDFFQRSLSLQPKNNPSDAALIDIYGLEVRRLPLSQRTDEQEEKLLSQVNKVKKPEFQSSDSSIALAKYFLVNKGDKEKALRALNESAYSLEAAQDLHIVALTYALNNQAQKAEYFISLAERRGPRHNAVVWYRVFVSLLNGELAAANQQADWAQSLSPHWYPLLYVSTQLLNEKQDKAFEHLRSFPSELFGGALNNADNVYSLAKQLEEKISILTSAQSIEPFEAELIYLILQANKLEDSSLKVREYVSDNYPEKIMMLEAINGWLKYSETH